jgi:hypothetical protein
MRFTTAGVFTALALAIAPSLASAEVVYCTMALGPDIQGGYIAPDFEVKLDAGTGEALVIDGIIMAYNKKKPAVAKVSANTDTKLKLSWSVFTVSDSGQRTKMNYRATIFREKKQVQVLAQPVGYSNNFTGNGQCEFK